MTHTRIDPYPHRLGGHCGSGALRDLLDWSGRSWDRVGWDIAGAEGLVFGLGGGLAFVYLRVPSLKPPVYLVGRTADLELDICRRLGIATERQQTEDPDEGWRWVTDELDAGRPVTVSYTHLTLPTIYSV